MNGRGYDYNLGRFLSVDPIIQSPGDSQSLNAYSYLMNNPMSGTDPTGYMGCTASKIQSVCDNTLARYGGTSETFRADLTNKVSNTLNTMFSKGNGSQPTGTSQSNVSLQANEIGSGTKSGSRSEVQNIQDRYAERETVEVDSLIAESESSESDLGQTAGASRNSRASVGHPQQQLLNLRYNQVISQIHALNPGFSVVRPSNRPVSFRDVRLLESKLAALQGANLPQTYWPPNMGFRGPTQNIYLRPGDRIDRYGLDSGHFVSPVGTSFGQRALPREYQSLPYTQYRVLRPIHVISGDIAPAFGQLGGGTQYILPLRVRTLEQRGYLEKIK